MELLALYCLWAKAVPYLLSKAPERLLAGQSIIKQTRLCTQYELEYKQLTYRQNPTFREQFRSYIIATSEIHNLQYRPLCSFQCKHETRVRTNLYRYAVRENGKRSIYRKIQELADFTLTICSQFTINFVHAGSVNGSEILTSVIATISMYIIKEVSTKTRIWNCQVKC